MPKVSDPDGADLAWIGGTPVVPVVEMGRTLDDYFGKRGENKASTGVEIGFSQRGLKGSRREDCESGPPVEFDRVTSTRLTCSKNELELTIMSYNVESLGVERAWQIANVLKQQGIDACFVQGTRNNFDGDMKAGGYKVFMLGCGSLKNG